MRTLVRGRAGWLIAGLLCGAIQAQAHARPGDATSPAVVPPPSVTAPTTEAPDPEAVFRRALELERQRNWSAAIDAYDKAMEQWPDRTDFGRRRRLCETHFRLVRRYQDQSFRNV